MEATEYQCLKNNRIGDSEGYWIAAVKPEEIERIRVMRNSQIDFLRQLEPIDMEEQKAYFRTEIWPSFSLEHPKQILVSLFYGQEWIGYGGLVHIDWKEKIAEVSFLFEPLRSAYYQEDLLHYLALIKQMAFDDLKLSALTTETYIFRTEVRELLEKSGFRLEKVLKRRAFKRNQWQDSWLHVLKRERSS